jgi:hypothetical protein
MKKASKIMVAVMMVAMLAVSSVSFAGQKTQNSTTSIKEVATLNHFSALDGIEAEAMNANELDQVVGKATPITIPRLANFYYAYLWAYFLYSANLFSSTQASFVSATPISLP